MGNNLNIHSNIGLSDKWLGYSLTATGSGTGNMYWRSPQACFRPVLCTCSPRWSPHIPPPVVCSVSSSLYFLTVLDSVCCFRLSLGCNYILSSLFKFFSASPPPHFSLFFKVVAHYLEEEREHLSGHFSTTL